VTLPNFLVIGAAKSGTTALYHYLRQHPQVYMCPQKETNYFAFGEQKVRFTGPRDANDTDFIVTTLDSYKEQFEAASNELAIGEASPWYLYSTEAAANIARRIPDAKLIAVLRDPVDRAFSSYLHVFKEGRESLSFEEGLLAEEDRIARGWEPIWHYRRAGLYAEQVERFLELFSRDQMRFYLYDDFLEDPGDVLVDIYRFLGVDPRFVADISVRPNASGVPKNQLLGRLLLQPNRLRETIKLLMPMRLRYELSQRLNQRLLKKPPLGEETRKRLLGDFENDILALQDIIGRDLSRWFSSEPL
jgi:hypothetical protein